MTWRSFYELFIRAKGYIRKSFDNDEVLKGIDLGISSGSVYGLVGPNGAGKTTLMKIIAGLVSHSGNISRIKNIGVGFFPMVPDRLQHIYVSELLSFIKKLSKSKSLSSEILNLLGIYEILDKKVSVLSTGQSKRLLVAMTCICQKEVMIFDEPLNGMDPIMVKNFQKVIEILREESTILISSHQLLEMEKICNQGNFLHRGKVLQQGNLDIIKQRLSSNSLLMMNANEVSSNIINKFRDKNVFFELMKRSGDYCDYQVQINSPNLKPNDIIKELISEDVMINQFKASEQSLDQVFQYYYGE